MDEIKHKKTFTQVSSLVVERKYPSCMLLVLNWRVKLQFIIGHGHEVASQLI